MTARLYTFEVRDQATIRDSGLRTLRMGLIRRGVANPNVGPTSDFYVEFEAIANELAVVEANAVIKCDEQMPDTANGEALARLTSFKGINPRPAGGSVGTVVFDASADSLVPLDKELIDGSGQRYRVSVGGTYSDGELIPIEALDVGDSTNLDEDAALRWIGVAPPFSAPTALVGPGGLINGIPAEDNETLRARYFAHEQNPPSAGNPQHVAEIAEASSPAVQKAFVYPAVQGPATNHIAVVAAPTATNKNREVATATMTGTVVPYVASQLEEHPFVVTTSVVSFPVDMAIGLTLPEAPTASPPGPGGGWKDGTPWPNVNGTSTFKVAVTSVVSTTSFIVDAATPPTAGVSRIAWLSPTTWKLYSATVTGFSGTSGAYSIAIDNPFIGIASGAYIFPQTVNQQRYVDAVLAFFLLMGPGEKTSNASALLRGYRHPPQSVSWPYAIQGSMLRALIDAGEEVLSTSFLYRLDVTEAVALSGQAGTLVPSVPASVEDAPNIYVPRNIGLYRLP